MGNMPRALVADDFNGDGHLDIALANAGSEEVIILIGKGDGTFKEGEKYPTHRSPLAIIVSDFNRDHKDECGNCFNLRPMLKWSVRRAQGKRGFSFLRS